MCKIIDLEVFALNENQTHAAPMQECAAGQGFLPACAPLANPYVPYQPTNPEAYAPAQGFIRGTMFSGLDLPFMGMVNNQIKSETLLNRLQSLSFALTELGLYLDTHGDDKDAIELFQSYRDMYDELTAQYESQYGPLTLAQSANGKSFDWTQNPWPWDEMQKED